MSADENKEEGPETPYSQESTTLPSEASVEQEDGPLTTKKPAEKGEVIVIKPSAGEYKKSNRIEYSSAEEQDKERRRRRRRTISCCCQSQRSRTIIHRDDKVFRQKSNDKGRREN